METDLLNPSELELLYSASTPGDMAYAVCIRRLCSLLAAEKEKVLRQAKALKADPRAFSTAILQFLNDPAFKVDLLEVMECGHLLANMDEKSDMCAFCEALAEKETALVNWRDAVDEYRDRLASEARQNAQMREALTRIANLEYKDYEGEGGPSDMSQREKGMLRYIGTANGMATEALSALEALRNSSAESTRPYKSVRQTLIDNGMDPSKYEQKEPIPGWPQGPYEDDIAQPNPPQGTDHGR